jgi:DNA mismatch endonuclease (patch repair protein)
MRYRKHYGPFHIDVAFPREKIAVFLDSCFWHGCPVHGAIPRNNADFWAPKLARNKERDEQGTVTLTRQGWIVLRFWEHDLKDGVDNAVREVMDVVMTRRGSA